MSLCEQTAVLLRDVRGPVGLAELSARIGAPIDDLQAKLLELLDRREVVLGALLDDPTIPAACWWETWCDQQADWLEATRAPLEQAVRAERNSADADPRSDAAEAFQQYLVDQYTPPRGKRILALVQDAVRRPYSSAPSHASLRQAVRLATGYDPSHDPYCCPVHMLVLASHLGPVPYELEDLWPASCRSAGVKQLSDQAFTDRLPLLAGLLRHYLEHHADAYDTITVFAEGRYGAVVREAGFDGPISPMRGEVIVRVGDKVPRPYWQRYWIQLFRSIVAGLEPWQQEAAEARLRAAGVETRELSSGVG